MKEEHGEKRFHEFIAEAEELSELARDIMKEIMLGSDATNKHMPYSWLNNPVEKHLYKALGHITHHLKQRAGHEPLDGENHLKNALNRIVMSIAIEGKEDGVDKESTS